MNSSFDVMVLGLGGIGSAVVNDLAMKGFRVLGVEQFSPVHDLGSSHGETRAIRKAYFEDPRYVPLILRSYELWDQYEKLAGERLLEKTGCVIMGPEKSQVIEGCLRAAKSANLPYKMMGSDELTNQFGFNVSRETKGFFEPEGGYLLVEKSVDFCIKHAIKNGARLIFSQKISRWSNQNQKIEITVADRKYEAEKLILCAGAWTNQFLAQAEEPKPTLPLTPKRTTMFWFDQGKLNSKLPVYFQEIPNGPWIYGFPTLNGLLKIAFHNVFTDCNPDKVDRKVLTEEVEQILHHAKKLLPEMGLYSRGKTCMYTMTPDENFILGPLNGRNSNIFVACGFSGHGYKFAPVIGEIASRFVSGEKQWDIEFLNPYRF